ncbi:MAG: hypothetical protein AAFN30_12805 [Actinomycetota bacterium]
MGVAVEQQSADNLGWHLVPPVVAGLLLFVSFIGLLQALGSIGGWTARYESQGVFDTDRCVSAPLLVTSRVTCEGEVTAASADAPEPWPATMTGPQAAFGQNPPVGGELVPVYFHPSDAAAVYPLEGRTTELIRMLLGRFDALFVFVGAAAWLAGWYLTRQIPAADAEFRPYQFRFPQRFGLRSLGVKWMLVGIGWWLFDRLLLNDLLGTVGLG